MSDTVALGKATCVWDGARGWLLAIAIVAVCFGISWLTGIDRHYVLLVPFVLAVIAYVVWPRLRGRE